MYKYTNRVNQVSISVNHIVNILLFSVILFFAFDSLAFNVEAAANAVFDPIVKLIDEHYAKGIILIGCAGAFMAPGDLRGRSIGFVIGLSVGALFMALFKASFTV